MELVSILLRNGQDIKSSFDFHYDCDYDLNRVYDSMIPLDQYLNFNHCIKIDNI